MPLLWLTRTPYPLLPNKREPANTTSCKRGLHPSTTGKQECLVAVGAVQSDNLGHQSCRGSNRPASSSTSFTLPVDLQFGSITLQTMALLDSWAKFCFMDILFTRTQGIPVVRNTIPIPVEVIDGPSLSSSAIKEATIPLILRVGCHQEEAIFNLIASPRHPIILGLSWLEKHNLVVDWHTRSIDFFPIYRPQEFSSTLRANAPAFVWPHEPSSASPSYDPVRTVVTVSPTTLVRVTLTTAPTLALVRVSLTTTPTLAPIYAPVRVVPTAAPISAPVRAVPMAAPISTPVRDVTMAAPISTSVRIVPTAAPISAPVSVVHTVASTSLLPDRYVGFSDVFEKRNVDYLP